MSRMNISIEVNDKDLIIDILRIAYDLDVDAEKIPKITAPTTEKVEEKEAVEELVEEKTDEEPVDTSPTWHGHGSPALTPQELYETQKKGENNVGLAMAMFPDLLSLTSIHHKYVTETLQWAKNNAGELEEETVEVEVETTVVTDEIGFTTQEDCSACNGSKHAHTCGYLGNTLRPSVAIIEEQFTTKKDCKACQGRKTKHTCGYRGTTLRPTVIAKLAKQKLLERLEKDIKTSKVVEETAEEIVEEKPKTTKAISPSTRKRSGRRFLRPHQKGVTTSELTLTDIDQIDKDVDLVGLYNAEIFELQHFVDSEDTTLSRILGTEISDVLNMKRQAIAMIRSNRMRGIADKVLKRTPKKKEKQTINVDSLVDSDYAAYAWEGIAHFKSKGTLFVQREVVDRGIVYAEDTRIIEGDREKFRQDLSSTVAEMFEIISKHDSQFLLTKDDSVGAVMLSLTRDANWPTRKEVIGDL